MSMILLFFFSSKEHLQLFVDYMNKQHKCLKFTSEVENDNSFSFLDIKITHHNQQFKTENQLSVVHLRTMDQRYKKSLILYYFAAFQFALTTPYFI